MVMLFVFDCVGVVYMIQGLCCGYDVVILDCYVVFNVVYSVVCLYENVVGKVVVWVQWIEFVRFGLFKFDWQVFFVVFVEFVGE